MQLAIVVDAASPFVRKTYLMEGNVDIVVDAYNNLQEVATAAVLKYYPNVHVMANKMADGDGDWCTELLQQAERCIQPAINFYLRKFNQIASPMFATVHIYKAIRIFCPVQVHNLQPRIASVDQLCRIPLLNSDAPILSVKGELPANLVAVTQVQ